MNLDPYLTPSTKIKSRWIIELNVKAKIIKDLKENIGDYHHELGIGKDS